MRTFSTKAAIIVKDNYFEDSLAVWGSIFCLEQCFSVFVENNIFLNNMARSFLGNNYGTGGFLVIIGNENSSASSLIGKNNIYFNLWTEHKG